jgi:hypothetical protein
MFREIAVSRSKKGMDTKGFFFYVKVVGRYSNHGLCKKVKVIWARRVDTQDCLLACLDPPHCLQHRMMDKPICPSDYCVCLCSSASA